MKKLNVTAVVHKDVRGKELYYLIIRQEEGNEELVVNVGEKTYETVSKMANIPRGDVPVGNKKETDEKPKK